MFKLWPKWCFFTYFMICWRPFWKAPYIHNFQEFWKYAICYCFLLFIAYKSDFTLQKSFSHHFQCSWKIMAKMVIFHLFQDILEAILKGALYLEFFFNIKISCKFIWTIMLSADLTYWIIVLKWNWNSEFKKHFLLIWIFILWQKWWFFTYLWIFWRPFWKVPYI